MRCRLATVDDAWRTNLTSSAGCWGLSKKNPEPDDDGLQGLLLHAWRRQDGIGQGNQAGLPPACAEAPSRRESGRQGRREQVQGAERSLRGARRSRKAQE